jgi:hypothetical protein
MDGKASGAVAIEGDNGKPLNAASHAPPPQRLQMEFFNRLLTAVIKPSSVLLKAKYWSVPHLAE